MSSGHRAPENFRNPRRLARQLGSQAMTGVANGPAIFRFGWTISDNGQLCQPVCQGTGRPEVGFQAELGVVSIWIKARILKLTPIRKNNRGIRRVEYPMAAVTDNLIFVLQLYWR